MVYSCVMKDCIAIFGAVKEEIAGVKKAMNISDRIRLEKSNVWTGKWGNKNLILVLTGVGRQRAKGSALQVVERFQPKVLLSIGYAGGVQNGLNVGDLILANSIANESKERKKYFTDTIWLSRAQEVPVDKNIKKVVGGLLTVNQVIHDTSEKQELGKNYRVQAVEMESWEIAKVADEKNIPFFSVRVISDRMDQKVLDSSSFLDSEGEISRLKAGWYVLTHPSSIGSAFSLRTQILFANQTMTRFLKELLN